MAARALADLRILDLSDGIAGACCTKLLAGHGAEVITIEPPDTGQRLRMLGPWSGDVLDATTRIRRPWRRSTAW